MGRPFFLKILFLTLSLPLFGQTIPADMGEKENLKNLINYFNERKIDFEERPLLRDYGGFGSSLHVRINRSGGNAPDIESADNTFVLAVPLDSDFSIETALAFIGLAKAEGSGTHAGQAAANSGIAASRPALPNLLIAFLGNEKSELNDPRFSHTGLRDLASLQEMTGTWVVCYLEIDETPESLRICHGGADYISPLELVKPLPSLFKAREIPASFEVRFNELYKLGLARGSEELSLLWSEEIDGICLNSRPSDFGKGKGESGDSGNSIDPENLAELLLEYSESITFPLASPDRHYTLVSLAGKFIIFLSEKTALFFLITSLGILFFILIVYSAAHRVIFISKLRLFLKHCWILLFLFPLLILLLQGAGFLYALLLTLFKVPIPRMDFWGSMLIILLGLWLFLFLSHGLDYLRFPRKAGFYAVSAIISAGIGLFCAIAFDITFIALFLWAFVFTFLGALQKKPWQVFLCAFCILVVGLGLLNNIRELGGLAIHFFVPQSGNRNLSAVLQTAFLALPHILLLKRGLILMYHKRQKHFIPLWFWIGAPGFLILLMTFQIMGLSRTAHVQTRRSIEENFSIFGINLTETEFLESRIIEISMFARGNPLRFDLYLENEDRGSIQLYSSPVPYDRTDEDSLMFILGENPPNPLDLEFVVPHDFRGYVRGEAIYNYYEREIDPEPAPTSADYIFLIRGNPLTIGIPE